MRTGRSKDLDQREYQHGRDPVLGDFKFEVIWRTDKYDEQRGLAQIAHKYYDPPYYFRNDISPNNGKKTDYMNAAYKYLRDNGEDVDKWLRRLE